MLEALKLSSKARTLQALHTRIKTAKVLPVFVFNVNDYNNDKHVILKNCLEAFDCNLIVRSSAYNEDKEDTSNAGTFKSVLNVKANKESIEKAITQVISSYQYKNDNDEVFIQPMLENVTLNGVVFTSDLDTLSPYYIINYDLSGSTLNVTNGSSNKLKTLIVYKNYTYTEDKNIESLLKAVKECEDIFNNKFLDIEFAISNQEVYILQVRNIVSTNKEDLSTLNLDNTLNKLYKKIKKLNMAHPKLLGTKTIFGVMPDWNPAEIIGLKPKKLALSLYKELITDDIWAYQRDNYGYRNLRSFPLLISFIGIPYIDVRVSFNSFIPKKLHENISSKLVEYYLFELSKNTNHHDKVEFEIVYSCYYFGVDKKLEKLNQHNFNDQEIRRIEFELLEITNNIINTKNGLYQKDLKKIETLQHNYDTIIQSELSIVDKIYWLIEDCKRYGTLPFAGIARAAFIAMQFLNSLVDENIISKDEKELFLNSLNTISKRLCQDKQKLTKKKFLETYGHLRPGTYNICSDRYDQSYEKYFEIDTIESENTFFEFSDDHLLKIDTLLIENGIRTTAVDLVKFIKESIEGREYSKFIFTKNLSKVLQLIEEFGNKLGIKREDLAYLDIKEVKNLYATLDHREVKDIFESNILSNKNFFEYTKAIKLPSVLLNENDIFHFYLEEEEPNFITLNTIEAEVVDIEQTVNSEIKGKIIVIESADPGYDYIFSKQISGLITCYGGANSHMAIRCAELGIPAVIGCGESLYEKYKQSKKIMIDSLNKQIKVIS